jgi:hypothetical protein
VLKNKPAFIMGWMSANDLPSNISNSPPTASASCSPIHIYIYIYIYIVCKKSYKEKLWMLFMS